LLDETVDMVWAARKVIQFFRHESCGKCTPCREGTYWLEKRMDAIWDKKATPADIKLIEDVANQINGKCLCALGDFATSPITSSLRHFRSEYMALVEQPKAAAKPAPKAAPAKAAVTE
jgi:NADH-quinone oxidoreductase subunit F